MYAQMIKSEASNEDPATLEAFQARIDAGERSSRATGCPKATARR